MQRIFVIIAIVVAVALIGFGAWWFFAGKSAGNPDISAGPSGGLPAASSSVSADFWNNKPTTPTFVLQGAQGSVTVKNFYLANPEKGGTRPEVDEGDVVILVRAKDYFISYDELNNDFWVAVTGSPAEQARAEAETGFLAILGISKQDACRLTVSVGSSAAGSVSGPLSFCGAAFK